MIPDVIYNGEPTKGLEFYTLLENSDEFTSELGKVTLAYEKLESELFILMKANGIKVKIKRATLGSLIDVAEKNAVFEKNMIYALKDVSKQRNYITHNIYALFIDQLDETIMEKNNLLDSDVQLYTERAWQLKENLIGLANIIRKKNLEDLIEKNKLHPTRTVKLISSSQFLQTPPLVYRDNEFSDFYHDFLAAVDRIVLKQD